MTDKRIAAALCFASFLVMGITSSILGPTLSNIAATLKLDIKDAGILRAAQQVGFLAATFAGGYILNRNSLRAVLIPSVLISAVGLIWVSSTGQLAVGLMAMLVLGVGSGLVNLGGNVAIGVMYEKNASAVLSALHMFFGLGLFVGPVIAEQALQRPDGWHWAYIVPAAAYGVLLILFLLIRIENTSQPAASTRDRSAAQAASHTRVRWLPLIPLTLLLFTYTGAGNGLQDWIATHLQLVGHVPADQAAQVTALYGLLLTVGRAVGIIALNRLGNMRALAIAIGIATVGATLILLAGTQVGLVAVGVALVGFGFSPIYPTVVAIGGNQQPENRGTVTGITTGLSSIGAIVIPVLHGWIGHGESGGMIVTFASTLIMVASLIMIQATDKVDSQRLARAEQV